MEILLALLMFYEVNLYRLENNLPVVPVSNDTCERAEKRLEEIKVNFSHDGFVEHVYESPERGYFNENLGRYLFSNKTLLERQVGVLEAWKKSPTHNENFLKELDSMCFRTDGIYWVMEGFKESND